MKTFLILIPCDVHWNACTYFHIKCLLLPDLTRNGMFTQIFVKLSHFMKVKDTILKLLHVSGQIGSRQTNDMHGKNNMFICARFYWQHTKSITKIQFYDPHLPGPTSYNEFYCWMTLSKTLTAQDFWGQEIQVLLRQQCQSARRKWMKLLGRGRWFKKMCSSDLIVWLES
jgi:hypothetical protein